MLDASADSQAVKLSTSNCQHPAIATRYNLRVYFYPAGGSDADTTSDWWIRVQAGNIDAQAPHGADPAVASYHTDFLHFFCCLAHVAQKG